MKKLIAVAAIMSTVSSAYAVAPQMTHTKKNVKLSSLSVNRVSKAMLSPVASMEKEALALNKSGSVKIAQKYKNLDVYGGEVIFQIENGKVISMDGRISNILLSSITPKLTQSEAKKVANTFLNKKSPYTSKLVVYPTTEKTYLAWHLVQTSFDEKWNLFVDAQEGKVIDSFNALANGKGRGSDGEEVELDTKYKSAKGTYVMESTGASSYKTYDLENGSTVYSPFWLNVLGKIAKSSDDNWGDSALVDAHNFAGQYLKVLKEKFNRNSYDNKGATVVSVVHYMKNYNNAFWNDKQMVYGDGDGKRFSNLSGGFDVVAHEISHAITTHTSNLAYRNESGAMNEAFSDIMATYAEYVVQPSKFDWMIGEDVWTPGQDGDALRYMNNPKLDGKSYDYYPERYQGGSDNGGVHINSGIANLAFYLLSEGGVHPRKGGANIHGLGIETAIKLFYNTFTKRLTSNATFQDARDGMIKEASEFGEEAVKAVADVWTSVGVE